MNPVLRNALLTGAAVSPAGAAIGYFGSKKDQKLKGLLMGGLIAGLLGGGMAAAGAHSDLQNVQRERELWDTIMSQADALTAKSQKLLLKTSPYTNRFRQFGGESGLGPGFSVN